GAAAPYHVVRDPGACNGAGASASPPVGEGRDGEGGGGALVRPGSPQSVRESDRVPPWARPRAGRPPGAAQSGNAWLAERCRRTATGNIGLQAAVCRVGRG